MQASAREARHEYSLKPPSTEPPSKDSQKGNHRDLGDVAEGFVGHLEVEIPKGS